MEKNLAIGKEYVVYGKVNSFRGQVNIPHPEIEELTAETAGKASSFAPVYPSTDKLNAKGLDAKGRRKLMLTLMEKLLHQTCLKIYLIIFSKI